MNGPVIAYRRWFVSTDGILTSIGVVGGWLPGVTTAECRGYYEVRVRVPVPLPYPLSLTEACPVSMMPPGHDYFATKIISVPSCHPEVSVVMPGHPVPVLHSKCGIWAHKLPIPDCACQDFPSGSQHGAVGVVRLWGRAVEHVDGWRALYAEPVAVVDYTGRLSEEYRIPRYPDTAAMWAEWAPGHQGWAPRYKAIWCGYSSMTPVSWMSAIAPGPPMPPPPAPPWYQQAPCTCASCTRRRQLP